MTLAIAITLAGGAAVLIWLRAPALLEWAAARATAARGMPALRFHAERPGLGRWVVREIEIGGGRAGTVEELSLRYSLSRLLRGKLDSVTVNALRLRGAWSADGLFLGDDLHPIAFAAARGGRGGGAESPAERTSIAGWLGRVGELRVRDARATLGLANMELDLAFDARLDERGLRGRLGLVSEEEELALRIVFGSATESSPAAAQLQLPIVPQTDSVPQTDREADAPPRVPPPIAERAWWAQLSEVLPLAGRIDFDWHSHGSQAGAPSAADVALHFEWMQHAFLVSGRDAAILRIGPDGIESLARVAPQLSRLAPWLERLGGRVALRTQPTPEAPLRARLTRSAEGMPRLAFQADLAIDVPRALADPLRGDVAGAIEFGVAGRGPSIVDLRARVAPVAAKALLELAGRLADRPGPLLAIDGVLPPIDLHLEKRGPEESLRLDARVVDGLLAFPEQRSSLLGIDAQAQIVLGDELAVDGRLDFEQLLSLAEPAGWAPVAGRGTYRIAKETLTADLDLEQTGSGAAAAIRLRRPLGERGAAAADGGLRIALSPLDLPGESAALQQLSPLLAEFLTHARGAIEGTAGIRWPSGDRNAQLTLKGVELAAGDLALAGVNGVLRVAEPFSPDAPPQRLEFERGTVGVEVRDGVLEWVPLAPDALRIHRLEWKMLDGAASLAGTIDLSREKQQIPVHLEKIHLARAVEELGIEDLTARGRLSGVLPIEILGESVQVHAGRLRSSKGRVRYRPKLAPAGLQAGGGVDVALDVLDNFHFEDLEIDLDGALDGVLQVGIRLRGANPDYYDGHPVDLNLGLEVPAGSLIRSYLLSLRLPDAIEERLRKY